MMKRLLFLIFGLILLSQINTQNLESRKAQETIDQELQHEAIAINIEVPVRVFKGDAFVENLTIDDFEVYEDGILQKIEAVYLIKKTTIKREETENRKSEFPKVFSPETSRQFILMFEVTEYLPRIGEVIDYFFKDVILPRDTLTVITPIKTYNFNKRALQDISREEIGMLLKNRLKKDATMGGAKYKSLLRDYKYIERLKMEEDLKRQMLLEKVREIKRLKYIEEKRLEDFAEILKNMEGQKNVFLFYQKEMIPVPVNINDMEYLELFSNVSFNLERVKQSFADSSISSHFIFITKTPADEEGNRPSEQSGKWIDQSSEIFSAFKELAVSTGGLAESTFNLASAFQKAVVASENYYLLYYTPKNYKPDGTFKKIEVKIPGKKYKITHRAGYVAE